MWWDVNNVYERGNNFCRSLILLPWLGRLVYRVASCLVFFLFLFILRCFGLRCIIFLDLNHLCYQKFLFFSKCKNLFLHCAKDISCVVVWSLYNALWLRILLIIPNFAVNLYILFRISFCILICLVNSCFHLQAALIVSIVV